MIAKGFFLDSNRGALKHVPSCLPCNHRKSELERYALTVLPLANRQAGSEVYAAVNVDRRLAQDRRLHRELASGLRPALEVTAGGLLLPTATLPLDGGKIAALLGMVVRGLYLTDFGFVLGEKWIVEVSMMTPEQEHALIFALQTRMGTNVEFASGDIGGETFRYHAVRSRRAKYLSLWQIAMFGGIQFSRSGHARGVRKLIAVTRPDMKREPFSEDEHGILLV